MNCQMQRDSSAWNILHTGRALLKINQTVLVYHTSSGALDRDGTREGTITKMYEDITM